MNKLFLALFLSLTIGCVSADKIKKTKVKQTAKPQAVMAPPIADPAPVPPVEKPVEYQITKVDLDGEIVKGNINFELLCEVKTKGKLDLVLVGGEICEISSELESMDGGSWFGGAPLPKLKYLNQKYTLECPEAGEYKVKFKFAASVRSEKKLKRCEFELIPALSREVAINCDSKDIELNIVGALNLREKVSEDKQRTTISAVLPPEGSFKASWERHIEKIGAELVTSVDSKIIYQILPGTVKVGAMFDYTVIQGKLDEIEIAVSPNLNILNIQGRNIQDWRVSSVAGKQILVVKLSSEFEEKYSLGIEAEKILADFPCDFEIPTLNPQGALRVDGFLNLGTNKAVKLIIDKVSGMNQVDNRTFSLRKIMGLAMPERSRFTFKYSGDKYGSNVKADNITPSYQANYNYILNFKGEELAARMNCQLEIKDASLRELMIEFDPELNLNRVEGPRLVSEDYEIINKNGGKWLKIPFLPNTIGKIQFTVYFEKNLKDRNLTTLPHLRIDGAKSVRGYVLLAAGKGLTLELEQEKNLRPTHTGSAPVRVSGLQLAYRFKEQNWSGNVKIKHEKAAIVSEVFHLYSIGEGTIYGCSSFTWHIAGAPVDKIRFAASPNMKNLEFTGRSVIDWSKAPDSTPEKPIWRLNLRDKILGDYTLLATYEIPLRGEETVLRAGDIATLDAEGEYGFIALSSLRNLKITDRELPESSKVIELSELPREYRGMIRNPTLKVYRYDKRGEYPELAIKGYASEKMLDIVLDHTEINTHIDRNGEAVTKIEYRIKNSNRQFLKLKLPKESKLWEVKVANEARRLSIANEELLVPLPRYYDINRPIPVSVTYAKKHGELNNEKELFLKAPKANVEAMFCRWTLKLPDNFDIVNYQSNLTSDCVIRLSGVPGILKRSLHWLSRWTHAGLSISWGLLSAAGLIIALSYGKESYRTLSTVLACVLVTLAIGFAINALGRHQCFPQVKPFSVNQVEFNNIFSQADQELRVDLKVRNMKSFAMGNIQSASIYFALGVMALAAVFVIPRKLRWLKPLTVALGIVLFVNGGAQWVYFNALTAFFLAGFFPILLSIGFCLLIYRKSRFPIAAALLLIVCLPSGAFAQEEPKPIIDEVKFSVNVTEKCVKTIGEYKIKAEIPGEIALLSKPAVLTGGFQELENLQIQRRGEQYFLKIEEAGDYEFALNFLLEHVEKGKSYSFKLPIPNCLKNTVEVGTELKNMSIHSANAISFQSKSTGELAMAKAIFVPGVIAKFTLRPQVRDVEKEKTEFFANIDTLVTFSAGFVACAHHIDLRIAQGEVSKFIIEIPKNMSVTNVDAEDLGAWRYEADSGVLELLLTRPRHGNYRINLVSQVSNCEIPFVAKLETLKLREAKRQHGSFGLTADSNVQIIVDKVEAMNQINISDFTFDSNNAKLKKAFRYHQVPASLEVKAIAIKPELRVYEKCALHLDEERSTLNSKMNLDIAKAGIFAVTIALPKGFEIDKITGSAIQHWDEIKEGEANQVIVNFTERIQGQTDMYLELSKMGGVSDKPVDIPRLSVLNTKKHAGELKITVERGTRMEILKRQGLEIKSDTFRKSSSNTVNQFSILRTDWLLRVKFEVAEPWIQVENLQVARVKNAFVENEMFIHYKIENAGVKRFRFQMPVGADTPEITGRQIAAITNPEANIWEVELHQKAHSAYKCLLRYRLPYDKAKNLTLKPVSILNTDMQKGYFTIFAEDSLQLKLSKREGEITSFDSRKIPAIFQAGPLADAALCFRTVGQNYSAELQVVSHKTAETLKAQMEFLTINSVVSNNGMMLSTVDLALNNRNDNFLRVKLPKKSKLCSVFIDDQPVDCASENNEMLVPLKQNSASNRSQNVRFIYSTRVSETWNPFSQSYTGPSFSLPLRQVTWKLNLPKAYKYQNFSGTMDHLNDSMASIITQSVDEYDQENLSVLTKNINQAKSWLRKGNDLAQVGKQVEAQEAFQNAMNLSENNHALNTDIQGQQLKVQRDQVITGFASRRNLKRQRSGNMRSSNTRSNKDGQMEFQNVKQQYGGAELRNLQTISDKIFMQQQAAQAAPHPLRITVPEKGRVITFERKLCSKIFAPLEVKFTAEQKLITWKKCSTPIAIAALALLLTLCFGFFSFASRYKEPKSVEDSVL